MLDLVTPQRDLEEEPQGRDRLVDGRYADAARCQMELIAAHILKAGQIRRSSEEGCEVLDPLHVVMLGLCANLRIVMSSIMRRPKGLMASSVMGMLLSWVKVANLSSQDWTPRCAILSAVLPAVVLYRASGLVPWPITDSATNRSGSRATRAPEREVSSTGARHSRVQSLTTVTMRSAHHRTSGPTRSRATSDHSGAAAPSSVLSYRRPDCLRPPLRRTVGLACQV